MKTSTDYALSAAMHHATALEARKAGKHLVARRYFVLAAKAYERAAMPTHARVAREYACASARRVDYA